MKTCDRMIDVDALIDGEAGEEAPEIERHVQSCAICRAYLADTRRNDALLRHAAQSTQVPVALEERLFGLGGQSLAPAPARIGRRRMLAGLGMVASVGGLGILLRQTSSSHALAGTDFRDAVMGDFATNIAADRPLDIAASEPGRIMPWISARVPFVLPERVAPEGTRLLGCRLCWLVGRRLAAFSMEVEDTPLGLYIAGADGLSGLPGREMPPLTAGRDGLRGAFWRDRGLALGIVGTVPASRLADLAKTLQG